MKKAVFIVAKEMFRDEEYEDPKKILEQAKVKIITASKSLGIAQGKFGATAKVDLTLQDIKPQDYDAVIFVGGPGSHDYFNDPEAHRIAKETLVSNKILAAICSAVGILANADVLKGKKVTSFPAEADLIKSKGGIHTGTGLEQDGNIITANGPQSAKIFGEAILKGLF